MGIFSSIKIAFVLEILLMILMEKIGEDFGGFIGKI
jgi:hypothetical protein